MEDTVAQIPGISDTQRAVLLGWVRFLKASYPVVEAAAVEPAMRYSMCLSTVPKDNTSVWSDQATQVGLFCQSHRVAISGSRPDLLPRETRDVGFSVPGADNIFVNVGGVFAACADMTYKQGLWMLLLKIAQATGATQSDDMDETTSAAAADTGAQQQQFPPPMFPVAATPQAGGDGGGGGGPNLFGQMFGAMQSIIERQARENPIPEDATINPAVISQRVMTCLNSPEMARLVDDMMQRTFASNQNPENVLRDSQSFLTNAMSAFGPGGPAAAAAFQSPPNSH